MRFFRMFFSMAVSRPRGKNGTVDWFGKEDLGCHRTSAAAAIVSHGQRVSGEGLDVESGEHR